MILMYLKMLWVWLHRPNSFPYSKRWDDLLLYLISDHWDTDWTMYSSYDIDSCSKISELGYKPLSAMSEVVIFFDGTHGYLVQCGNGVIGNCLGQFTNEKGVNVLKWQPTVVRPSITTIVMFREYMKLTQKNSKKYNSEKKDPFIDFRGKI